jgi:hypothetical protein
VSLIDFILNVAGLLLWLNWRSARIALHRPQAVVSIANSLQRADPVRGAGWSSLGALILLLGLRALFYHTLGPKLGWVPYMDFLAVNLPWRSDDLLRMTIFSVTSFGVTLYAFYSWLLLLSALNRSLLDSMPIHRWVRYHLGLLEKLPAFLKVFLPILFVLLLWPLVYKGLVLLKIAPEIRDTVQLWQSGGVLGIASLFLWRWLIVLILAAHLLNTYLYLGEDPIWKYASATARNLLHPIRFLRAGKLDLAPILGLVLILSASHYLPGQLNYLYRKLPL